jgi:hypothetical protein
MFLSVGQLEKGRSVQVQGSPYSGVQHLPAQPGFLRHWSTCH